MKPLPIPWTRLVDEGEACPRCGSTRRNAMAAIARLEPAPQLLDPDAAVAASSCCSTGCDCNRAGMARACTPRT